MDIDFVCLTSDSVLLLYHRGVDLAGRSHIFRSPDLDPQRPGGGGYTSWDDGYPVQGEDCVLMLVYGGLWIDYDCSWEDPSVCELDDGQA